MLSLRDANGGGTSLDWRVSNVHGSFLARSSALFSFLLPMFHLNRGSGEGAGEVRAGE